LDSTAYFICCRWYQRRVILTSKHPSPDTKPAIQLGSGMFSVLIIGLSTGVNLLNSDFKKSDKPKLIDALMLII
jgi:hypothetical protein